MRYFRRINVQASCLACHGLKDNRPEFVKKNYPQDLAYNFKVGDLREVCIQFLFRKFNKHCNNKSQKPKVKF